MNNILIYLHRYIIAIITTAALLTLSFPPFDLYYMSWFALVPLLLLTGSTSNSRIFFIFLLTGTIFFSGLLWWILKTDGFNAINFALGILVNAIYFGIFGTISNFLKRNLPCWTFLSFPSLWVVLEYFRSHQGFLSFSWGIMGYSQYSFHTVTQLSSFTGVYGVSFLIILVNTIAAEIILYLSPRIFRFSRSHTLSTSLFRKALFLQIIFLLIISISIILIKPAKADIIKNNLKVALIQANVFWNEKQYPRFRDYANNVFRINSELSMEAAGQRPLLIAWPSSSAPGRIPFDGMLTRTIGNLAKKTRSFLLIGTGGYDKFSNDRNSRKKVANSSFLFSPDGSILGQYNKIRLLPFDEYLPLRDHITWPSWIISDMIDSKPGNELTVFTLQDIRFGVQICWENLFPDQFRAIAARNVDFMVSMTNEAFTKSPGGHYQMLAMNVFRAIENGISIVRTAPTGVSAIITPDGQITDRVQDKLSNDVNVAGYSIGDIPISSSRTFYTRYGDLFIYSLFFLISIFITWAFIKQNFNPEMRSS